VWLATGGYDQAAVAAVIGSLVTLAGVVLTVVTSVRSSSRAEAAKREDALDDRVDAEVARLMTENTTLRQQRDEYWRQRNELADRESAYRRWIWSNGGDPNEALHG
jgi:hypothetical protein